MLGFWDENLSLMAYQRTIIVVGRCEVPLKQFANIARCAVSQSPSAICHGLLEEDETLPDITTRHGSTVSMKRTRIEAW